MDQKKLCEWLRDNSAGVYRPAADAAIEIERLQALVDHYEAQRQGWRCSVGEEVFSTHDEDVAKAWEADGFELEVFFVRDPGNGSKEAFFLPDKTFTTDPGAAAEAPGLPRFTRPRTLWPT